MIIPYVYFSRKLDKLSTLLGYSIPLNCLGYGVFLAHYGSCIINGRNRIGNYSCIFNNVCIADGNPKKLGTGVFYSTGVVVCKKVNIADGCKISANSLVNKSCEIPNTLLGGIPAKELKHGIKPWYYDEPWISKIKTIEKLKSKMEINEL